MTPLSDRMDAHAADSSPQNWIAFLAAFQRSKVGVMMEGLPDVLESEEIASTAERPISIGLSEHPGAEGRSFALAFADPAAFAERFGRRFNAMTSGEALLRTVFHNPECDGVLVNSATAEISVVIDRETATRLVAPAPPGHADKP